MCPIDIADISCTFKNAEHAVINAIDLILLALSSKRFFFPSNSNIYKLMRRDIPYSIYDTSIAEKKILLNMNYKPLGSNLESGERLVNYNAFQKLQVNLTENQLLNICHINSIQYQHIVFDFQPSSDRFSALLYLGALIELLSCITTDLEKLEKYKSDIQVRLAISYRRNLKRS
jgi:hypothetical protein